MRTHAIYAVLNDFELFRASLASIYNHVEAITVTTAHDRDWRGETCPVEGIVDAILSREMDPDRKVDLIVSWEPNESRSRNRAMDFADPSPRSRRVLVQHSGDRPPPAVDYFWIIDADEIYEAASIQRIKAYVSRTRLRYYQVPAVQYFKSWNYRVAGYEWFTAFVRADMRVGHSRNPFPSHLSRLAHKLHVRPDIANRLIGLNRIPPEVGVFHHGSYVGPRSRIEAKINSSSHAHRMRPRWLEEVWDVWHPAFRDFHPVDPAAMPAATPVPLSDLPAEITAWNWPQGYLEDAPSGL